ncbi:hypothetical protein [Caballeronia sp. DA-9]|uniref:hypothetical protein n=1 Tax=Caballeronia sp. DA-9 TaxID=3436237 RepID=UPI003F671C16
MFLDAYARAAIKALYAFLAAAVPTDVLIYALLTAVMELVNKRSGLPVTMRVGDVQIRRSGK